LCRTPNPRFGGGGGRGGGGALSWVIAGRGADSAALGSDSCPDIVQVPADEIKAPSSTLNPQVTRYLKGIAVSREGTISVLDVDKVLQC